MKSATAARRVTHLMSQLAFTFGYLAEPLGLGQFLIREECCNVRVHPAHLDEHVYSSIVHGVVIVLLRSCSLAFALCRLLPLAFALWRSWFSSALCTTTVIVVRCCQLLSLVRFSA